jgi:carbamoyltransferase
MNTIGISAGYHDAGLAVVSPEGEILFAGHSERYSKLKNDPNLCEGIINEVDWKDVGTIAYYERPWMHNVQQFRSGQENYGPWTTKGVVKTQLEPYIQIPKVKYKSYRHHLSHAALGFQTSTFTEATCVVIDAIGELDTITIWNAKLDNNGKAQYKLLWSKGYPHSIGLFYSAMTKHIGLKPNEDEYILMGMSAYGNPRMSNQMRYDFLSDEGQLEWAWNFHTGAPDDYMTTVANDSDIAASTQALTESLISHVIGIAKSLDNTGNLVYSGGVALNCHANRLLGVFGGNIWIPPNPGDAGSALGAALLAYGRQVEFKHAFLGHQIVRPYPVNELIDELLGVGIVGVANGRAEWGPRALGHRSLLADPRDPMMKDRVNAIKHRQQFRPFAPMILEEQVDQYFHMPPRWDKSPYMQVTAPAKFPKEFPAVVHVDGTSRVQTVPNDGSKVRELLEKWFVLTGCPMLLNTSLNIKGEPMVNDESDAERFEKKYGVRVF